MGTPPYLVELDFELSLIIKLAVRQPVRVRRDDTADDAHLLPVYRVM